MAVPTVNFEEREGLGFYPVAAIFDKSVSAGDTLVVEKRDYPDLMIYVKVSDACDVVLEAVSGALRKPDGSYVKISVNETIMSFSAAGEQTIKLGEVLTESWALHFPYLHLKFTAATTIDFVAFPTSSPPPLTIKSERVEPERVLSAQTIGAASLSEFVVRGEGYSALVVTVRATYDASATAGVRVRWLYSPDNTNFDSIEDAEDAGNYEDLTVSAGATRQRTILIPLFQKYTKVQVVNLDDSVSVTVDAWKVLIR